MSDTFIIVRTLPLPRDYDEGETVTLVEAGKDIRMKLIAGALKGEREVRVIPLDNILN